MKKKTSKTQKKEKETKKSAIKIVLDALNDYSQSHKDKEFVLKQMPIRTLTKELVPIVNLDFDIVRLSLNRIFGLSGDYHRKASEKSYGKYYRKKDIIGIKSFQENTDSREAILEGTIKTRETDRVKILDEFLKQAKIDRDTWEVLNVKIGAFDVTLNKKLPDIDGMKQGSVAETYTNYTIKVTLKPKKVEFVALESLISKISHAKLPSFKLDNKKVKNESSDIMYEIALYDSHFGKLAWSEETGENYDLRIAEELFLRAIYQFHDRAKIFAPSKILFPVGNDFLHISNDNNTTDKGTRLDVDGRFAKIYGVAYETIIKSIDIMLSIPSVNELEIVWIGSNHDLWISYFLVKTIEAYYRNDERVKVDINAKLRKVKTWGINFIGFEHGELKPEKLAALLPDEFKNEWFNTSYREIHTGHVHKAKETQFIGTDTFGGIVHRHISSLCKTDFWHYRNGYVNHMKAATSFVWDKKLGLVGQFPIYIK